MAGLAAMIFVSRVSTTRSDMGTGIEMDVISAVVLGGTSIFGGRGTMTGTVLGLLLIQTLLPSRQIQVNTLECCLVVQIVNLLRTVAVGCIIGLCARR